MVEEREAVSIKEEEEDVVVGIKTEEEEDEESIKMEEEQEEEELQTDQTLLQPPHVSSADVLVFEGELHQVQSGLLQSTSTTSEPPPSDCPPQNRLFRLLPSESPPHPSDCSPQNPPFRLSPSSYLGVHDVDDHILVRP